MRALLLLLLLLLGVGGWKGCSSARVAESARAPAVAFPARFAEGEQPAQDGGALTTRDGASEATSRPGDAAAEVDPPPSRSSTNPPDPDPLRLQRQFEYELLYDHGRIEVQRVRARTFPRPVVTARRMGRFAIELWIGSELIERVRFNFPLVGAESPRSGPRSIDEPPSLAAKAVVTRTVLVPASERATRAVLVDRATEATRQLPWPPDDPLPPPRSELTKAQRAALRQGDAAVASGGSAPDGAVSGPDSGETSGSAPDGGRSED